MEFFSYPNFAEGEEIDGEDEEEEDGDEDGEGKDPKILIC